MTNTIMIKIIIQKLVMLLLLLLLHLMIRNWKMMDWNGFIMVILAVNMIIAIRKKMKKYAHGLVQGVIS